MIVTNIQQQFWQALRRAWLRIARAGGLAALAGGAFGELGGLALNGGHVTGFMHLMSLLLALALGYGAALTVGIFAAVRGIFKALTEVETGLRSSMGTAWHVIDANTPEK
ncbi:MAG: hypothetical protein IVW57_18105 [Ktedonobacterales bacterium]|nr:hypothetical protein [Ktedonobacterales bacterium]